MATSQAQINRPLTDQERAWLTRGLKTLETGEYAGGGNWINTETNETLPLDEPEDPSPYLKQIDMLRVIDECGCGDPNCHTIEFRVYGSGATPALVTYHTEDGRMLNILVDEDTGELAELEII